MSPIEDPGFDIIRDMLSSELEDVQTLSSGIEEVEVDSLEGVENGVKSSTNFFSALVKELPKAEAELNPEDDVSEPEQETTEVEEKQPAVYEEKPRFNFTEEEIKAAIHGSLKKDGFKKSYTIYEGFTVTVQEPRDYETGILNQLSAEIITNGEKRTSVKIVDSYLDSKTGNYIPGGRIEDDYYFNPDADRENMRALTALMVCRIGDSLAFSPLTRDKGLADLKIRIEKLEEYSSSLLDSIYNKVVFPFTKLMQEASKRVLNF